MRPDVRLFPEECPEDEGYFDHQRFERWCRAAFGDRFSLRVIAAALGVQPPTVRAYLHGTRQPTFNTYCRMAAKAGESLDVWARHARYKTFRDSDPEPADPA